MNTQEYASACADVIDDLLTAHPALLTDDCVDCMDVVANLVRLLVRRGVLAEWEGCP